MNAAVIVIRAPGEEARYGVLWELPEDGPPQEIVEQGTGRTLRRSRAEKGAFQATLPTSAARCGELTVRSDEPLWFAEYVPAD